MKLTDKQKHVLNFIAEFCAENKYAPTSREISKHFRWKSQTAALNHLNALRRKGRISWVSGHGRTISIV